MPRLVTRAAIMAYEHDNGLPLSGAADEALLKAVVLGGAHAGAGPPAVAAPGPHAAQVTRTVQQWLAGLGYSPGPADGRFREETARAVRAFEIDQRMPATGRISGPLVARLARAAGQGRLARDVNRGDCPERPRSFGRARNATSVAAPAVLSREEGDRAWDGASAGVQRARVPPRSRAAAVARTRAVLRAAGGSRRKQLRTRSTKGVGQA